MKEKITQTWSDENGILHRTGKKGKKFFIDSISPAFEPDAGKIFRTWVTEKEYQNYDPDPIGELIYQKIN